MDAQSTHRASGHSIAPEARRVVGGLCARRTAGRRSFAGTMGPRILLNCWVVAFSTNLEDRLRHVGWAEGVAANAAELLRVARYLGEPGPSRPGATLVDHLVPMTRAAARRRSMSAVFGDQAFPFHTDLAHHYTPPRFVLLRAEQAEGGIVRPTLLLDYYRLQLTLSDQQRLAHSPFLVRGGDHPFLCAIADRTDRTSGSPDLVIRYDGCCMTPASLSARAAQRLLTQETDCVPPIRIEWRLGRTIVFDNWRILHGRALNSSPLQPERRVLQRVLVWPRRCRR